MKVCYCTLGGTEACINCPNKNSFDFPYEYNFAIIFPTKTKRIIEKFDEKGNLIERITEE